MSVLTPAQISVVLVEPSHPGNVGASARAMDNFGVTDLRLVNPCEVDHPDSRAFSKNARYLLYEAKTYEDLAEAVKDHHVIIGTSARQRDKIHTATSLTEISRNLAYFPRDCSVAIVFGREQNGLTNEEMSICNEWVYIPTFGKNPSLNLAQAILVVLYELSKLYSMEDTFSDQMFNPANSEQLEGMKQHFFQVLDRVSFIRHGARDSIWHSFACLIGRAKPDERDIRMIRGFFSQIETKIKRKEKAIKSLKSKSLFSNDTKPPVPT